MIKKSNILKIISCAGVVATGYISYKAAPKIKESVDRVKKEKFKNKDANVKFAKSLIPPLIAGSATIACILLYGHVTAKQIAALTAAGAATKKYLNKYRKKVVDTYGKEADEKIVAEIAKEDWGVQPYLPTPENEEEELFYEQLSGHGHYFYAKPSTVQAAMYHINRNFQLRGTASLGEFYDFIGIDYDGFDDLGWSINYYIEELGITPWIDFYTELITLDNGETAKVIGFDIGSDPISDYDEL